MKRIIYTVVLSLLLPMTSCKEVLEPEPVALQTSEVALNEPADVLSVQTGLYNSLRDMTGPLMVAGDFTADELVHRGTFTEFRELTTKQIRASNATVAVLWGDIYNTIYIANLILERLPSIAGVPARQRAEVTATAHFLRGFSYFVGAYTYGGIPLVTSTNLENNRNIPRASKEEVLNLVLEDYTAALEGLPEKPTNAGFAGKNAVRAAMARLYLYEQNWARAEQYATEVISKGEYQLETNFEDVVLRDFTGEAIFEMGYTIADDPGTTTYGLNNLYIGRREVIPSNQVIVALLSNESGSRNTTLAFDVAQQGGSDNGWSVRKYGTADEDNNNIVLFRLAEMYLIRAEARAHQNKITGINGAEEDVNVLRRRANAPVVAVSTVAAMLRTIEQERLYELAYEGHRWYDLVRTDRANEVLGAYSPSWESKYQLWPVPQREIQYNPGLRNSQNPGY